MNVASLELSRRLYELSGWLVAGWCPAYNAGYLLRKLPRGIEVSQPNRYNELYSAGFRFFEYEAETPEDALALLAIRLFEEEILKK